MAPAPAGNHSGELSRLIHTHRVSVGSPSAWLCIADVAGVALITALVAFDSGDETGLPVPLAAGYCLFVLFWTAWTQMTGLYRREALQAGLPMQLVRVLFVCALSLSGALAVGFAAGVLEAAPRRAVFLCAAGAGLWVMMARLAQRLAWQRRLAKGYCVERALVLADTVSAASSLAGFIEAESAGEIGIVGCAALPETDDVVALDAIEATARSGGIDRVMLCAGADAMPRVNAVLTRLSRLTIDVSILPDLNGLSAPIRKVDRVGTLPAVELGVRPLTRWQLRLKRTEDVVLALLATVFVLPVLALIALAIKLDSRGPVLSRQKRAAFNDRVFDVWTFRTMRAHARPDREPRRTGCEVSRETRVGRLLRLTGLDELPQLFNVLDGSMSIVGPRAHALGVTAGGSPLHEVTGDYSARQGLKPGITGWAQVNGCRSVVGTNDQLRHRVMLDCHYIEHWSPWLDLWIMARTARKILSDSNAY